MRGLTFYMVSTTSSPQPQAPRWHGPGAALPSSSLGRFWGTDVSTRPQWLQTIGR